MRPDVQESEYQMHWSTVVNTDEHRLKGITALQNRIRLVAPQPVAGDKTETKSNTESNTEISDTKRTCDAIVASPSIPTT